MSETPRMTLTEVSQDLLDKGMLGSEVECNGLQILRATEDTIKVFLTKDGIKMFQVEFGFAVGKTIFIPNLFVQIEVESKDSENGKADL
jgi:hypothetical protein